jgi:hypothetical protein
MPDLFGNSKFRDELNAWQKSISSLSRDDREVLVRAIRNAMQYGEFLESAPAGRETESFLLSILLSQQKKIEELKKTLGRNEKKS